MQNGSSVGISTRCAHVFACFGTDLYAQSVPINKISASELGRKLINSASLVGQVRKYIRKETTTVTTIHDESEHLIRLPTVSICPYHGYNATREGDLHENFFHKIQGHKTHKSHDFIATQS